MEQYIKKSAIVAEIRRYIKSAEAFLKYHHNKKDRLCYSLEHQRLTMCELLSFLDTLDVKEVDFEKEIENWMEIGPHTSYPWCTIPDAIKITAEHFYELGVRASNPITAADRGIANEIIFALNALGEEKMISYDKEIEWVMNKVKEGE